MKVRALAKVGKFGRQDGLDLSRLICHDIAPVPGPADLDAVWAIGGSTFEEAVEGFEHTMIELSLSNAGKERQCYARVSRLALNLAHAPVICLRHAYL